MPLQSEKELKKEGRGSFDYRIEREDNLYVIRWLDGGVVQLISSIYGEEPLKNVQRFLFGKKAKVEITQPYIVAVYNKNMGGVDKIDFLLSLYRISIRSRKWALKIFDHFIDLAICNSWLEYRKDHEGNNKGQKQKHMDLLEFRNDIADGLLAQANKDAFSRKRGRPKVSLNENIDSPSTSRKRYETAPSVSVRYDGNQHWVEYTEKKNRCKLKGCSGFSRYKCSKCSVHLCLPNGDRDCFKDYHCSD